MIQICSFLIETLESNLVSIFYKLKYINVGITMINVFTKKQLMKSDKILFYKIAVEAAHSHRFRIPYDFRDSEAEDS